MDVQGVRTAAQGRAEHRCTLAEYPAGTRGIIVTTSEFTRGTIELAKGHNARLMDGEEFEGHLQTAHASIRAPRDLMLLPHLRVLDRLDEAAQGDRDLTPRPPAPQDPVLFHSRRGETDGTSCRRDPSSVTPLHDLAPVPREGRGEVRRESRAIGDDKKLDAERHPAEIFAFLGVSPGCTSARLLRTADPPPSFSRAPWGRPGPRAKTKWKRVLVSERPHLNDHPLSARCVVCR
jgi:hypothetical protein